MYQVVTWMTRTRLSCSASTPSDVIICVNDGASSKILDKTCPITELDNIPLESGISWHTIVGQLVATSCARDQCNGNFYTYTLTYDDAQLEPGQTIAPTDIDGVICQGCLTTWVEEYIEAAFQKCATPQSLIVNYVNDNNPTAIAQDVGQTVNWQTQIYDPNGLVTTGPNWVFASPAAGVYTFAGSIYAGFYDTGVPWGLENVTNNFARFRIDMYVDDGDGINVLRGRSTVSITPTGIDRDGDTVGNTDPYLNFYFAYPLTADSLVYFVWSHSDGENTHALVDSLSFNYSSITIMRAS